MAQAQPTERVVRAPERGAVFQSPSDSGASGIRAVRKRIARIHGNRVVVQPVIIITPSGGSVPGVMPGPGGLNGYDRPLPFGLTNDEADIIRLYRERQARKETGYSQPGSTERDASGSTPPEVREIERLLLETGLFRTVDVVFEFDKSTLLPVSQRTLDAVGDVLVRYPDLQIEIGGHTDAVGTDAYNQRLSERRAEAVRQYLLDGFRIDPARLTTRGYGETRPVATNGNPTGRTLNRRVEFRVTEQ